MKSQQWTGSKVPISSEPVILPWRYRNPCIRGPMFMLAAPKHLPFNYKNIDHRNFINLLSFISQGTLSYMPCIILPKMANMEQSQSLFTRKAPTCNIKTASGGWSQPYCDCTGCLKIDRTSVLSETHLGTTKYRNKWIGHKLLHHLVSFLLVTQITRLKKSSKGVIYEESLHRRSASTWSLGHNFRWHTVQVNYFTVSLHSPDSRTCLPFVLRKGTVSGLWKISVNPYPSCEPIMHNHDYLTMI